MSTISSAVQNAVDLLDANKAHRELCIYHGIDQRWALDHCGIEAVRRPLWRAINLAYSRDDAIVLTLAIRSNVLREVIFCQRAVLRH
jgi:hypothetical protein